jgi:prepilin-type N-terminal cleavage/methylation domain-containing protein
MVSLSCLPPLRRSGSLPKKAGQGTGPRPRPASGEAGFTLVEVLVSTLILGFVIYLAMLSFSLFLNVWQRKKLVGYEVVEGYRAHLLVRRALASIYDYYVTDQESEKKVVYYPFFEGDRQGCRFVTLASVFYKDHPALARLWVDKSPSGGPSCRVLYAEVPLTGKYLKYADQLPEPEHTLVLYQGLRKATLRYYGAREIHYVPEREEFETVYAWGREYNGRKRLAVPRRVELTCTPEGSDANTVILYPVRAEDFIKGVYFNPTL